MAVALPVEISKRFRMLNLVEGADMCFLIGDTDLRVAFEREVLAKYRYFGDLFESAPGRVSWRIETTTDVLLAFRCFVEKRPIQTPTNYYSLVKFALRIGRDDFSKWCILNVQRNIEIPANSSDDEVLNVVGEIVRLHPLRGAEDYQPLVKVVQKWAANDDEKQNRVLDRIAATLAQKTDKTTVLAGLPLFRREVTVALMEMVPGATLRFAAYIDDWWTPIDLVGEHFDVSEEDVEAFHIVPFTYIVYRRFDNSVYFRDLTKREPPKALLDSCRIFRSIFGELLVVTFEEETGEKVFRWNKLTKQFEKLFSRPRSIVVNVSMHHYYLQPVPIVLTSDGQFVQWELDNVYNFIQPSYEDYVVYPDKTTWTKSPDEGVYTSDKSDEKFPCGYAYTHIGFEKLAVQPLSTVIGLYETESVGKKLSVLHGQIVHISDVIIYE